MRLTAKKGVRSIIKVFTLGHQEGFTALLSRIAPHMLSGFDGIDTLLHYMNIMNFILTGMNMTRRPPTIPSLLHARQISENAHGIM